jgi:ATP-dependent Clp endopeptidase proteolytic subunit ClpP
MKTWFRIENKAEKEATVYIHDEIGYYGVKASEFVKALNEITAKTINLHINSPGGNVFDGVTIYNALRDHKATIKVKIDGLAASIASVIAMAGDTVDIAKNAMMMIHRAWTIAAGNANEMRKTAEVLEKIDKGTVIGTYADKTGLDENKLTELVDAETWLTADEAKSLGFADTIGGETDAKACWDLTGYNNVPQAVLERFSAKHEKHQATERELEHLLRDAGVSIVASKAAISAIKRTELRDAGSVLEGDLVATVNQFCLEMSTVALVTKITS